MAELCEAVSRLDLAAVQQLLDDGSAANGTRPSSVPGDDGPDQPDQPLKMVMFRLSDALLVDADRIVLRDIAKLLLARGADPLPAMEIAQARYGAYPGPDAPDTWEAWHEVAKAASQVAQDPGELFEVLGPPPSDWDPLSSQPQPTGISKKRSAVHKESDWHQSVHVWLLDVAEGRVLLQKRSPHKDTFPGRWDISAAGHIAFGDSVRATALREAQEELGVDVEEHALQFLFCLPAEMAAEGGCNCYEHVFAAKWDSKAAPVSALGKGEVTSVRWETLEDLEAALARADETYVPRGPGYTPLFFKKVRAIILRAAFKKEQEQSAFNAERTAALIAKTEAMMVEVNDMKIS